MREMFRKQSPPWARALSPLGRPELQLIHPVDYLSDISDDDADIDDAELSNTDSEPEPKTKSGRCKNKPPPLKRRKLEVSY